jgi:hypothetical protein
VTHRIVGASLLALVLGGASPAFALTRLASFEWAPAAGPVAGYHIYARIGGSFEMYVTSVAVPKVVLPVKSSTYVSVRVAAYDSAGNVGPASEVSYPIRLCPGDFNGDEIRGLYDSKKMQSCYGKAAVGLCAGADLNDDGVVGMFDLRSWPLEADACAQADASAPSPCPGDFNGDHYIGIVDVTRANSCILEPAVGVCAAGDFDGDGIVSTFEADSVRQAIGSVVCAP